MKRLLSIVLIVALAVPLFGCSLYYNLASEAIRTLEDLEDDYDYRQDDLYEEGFAPESANELRDKLRELEETHPQDSDEPGSFASEEAKPLPTPNQDEGGFMKPKEGSSDKISPTKGIEVENKLGLSLEDIDPFDWLFAAQLPEERDIISEHKFDHENDWEDLPPLDDAYELNSYQRDVKNPYPGEDDAEATVVYVDGEVRHVAYTYQLEHTRDADKLADIFQSTVAVIDEQTASELSILYNHGLQEENDINPQMIKNLLQNMDNGEMGSVDCFWELPDEGDRLLNASLQFIPDYSDHFEDLEEYEDFEGFEEFFGSDGDDIMLLIYLQDEPDYIPPDDETSSTEADPADETLPHDKDENTAPDRTADTTYSFDYLDEEHPRPKLSVSDIRGNSAFEITSQNRKTYATSPMNILDQEGTMEVEIRQEPHSDTEHITRINYWVEATPQDSARAKLGLFVAMQNKAKELMGRARATKWEDYERENFDTEDVLESIAEGESTSYKISYEQDSYDCEVELRIDGDHCSVHLQYFFFPEMDQ